MTKTAETVNGFDVYSIAFETVPENIIFNNNGNGSQTADLKTEAGKYFYLKDSMWYELPTDVPELPSADDTITVYFEKPADWSGAFVHIIGSSVIEEKYPGYEMELVEGNKYSYKVPADATKIKFTDGTNTDPNKRTENVEAKDIADGRVYQVNLDAPTSGKTNSWAAKW